MILNTIYIYTNKYICIFLSTELWSIYHTIFINYIPYIFIWVYIFRRHTKLKSWTIPNIKRKNKTYVSTSKPKKRKGEKIKERKKFKKKEKKGRKIKEKRRKKMRKKKKRHFCLT